MEIFTNDIIDTQNLPKLESVPFTALNSKYGIVIACNLAMIIGVLSGGLFVLAELEPDIFSNRIWFIIGVLTPLSLLFIVCFAIIGFKKKGFAFREHDVVYRSGIIATNTIVIPYNRVQHVALHEGFVSRFLGLAKVQVFTAGGSASDIEIPGIEKEQAENIKQLLMGKIQKQL